MAANKPFNLNVALTTTTTTNILNPGTTTGGTGMGSLNGNLYFIVTHIRLVNKTNAAAFCALWKGATGANTAGTEFAFAGAATAGALNANTGVSVPANSYVDWYGRVPFYTADFLVGGCATATAVTLNLEGEIGVA